MNPKTAAVFGSKGQLGQELMRELSARGYTVSGSARADVDITDPAGVGKRISQIGPSVVFNAAAYNQVDVSEREPEAAYQANALAVRNLAIACRQVGAQLVHFSTDYVFDGFAGRPYTEEDATHPLGAYAVSKLAGELYAQAYLERPVIVRTSGVFGPGALKTPRGNFVELMLRLAAGSEPIRVVEDHVASPTFAPLLAARAVELVERDLAGVFHVGGGAPVSWFDYAKLIFRVAGLTPELRPTNERDYRTPARRPKFSALSNGKMERAGLAPMPPLEECLRRYFALRGQAAEEARA
jgi:dTDP-4-dehydrorhamnose reductase